MKKFFAFLIVSIFAFCSIASAQTKVTTIDKEAILKVKKVTAIQYTAGGDLTDITSGSALAIFEVAQDGVTLRLHFKDRNLFAHSYKGAKLQVVYTRTNTKPSYLISKDGYIFASAIYDSNTKSYILCPYEFHVG